MKKLFLIITLNILFTNVFATNYFVSTTGNDLNDGLTEGTAWASLDNGGLNNQNLLIPGDTVFILSGTYTPVPMPIVFDKSGLSGNPIVYQGYGSTPVIFDGGGNSLLFEINSDYTIFSNIHLKNIDGNGIEINGTNNLIKNCVISDITTYGIQIGNGAEDNFIYNNTFFNIGSIGVYPSNSVKTTRVINNIFYSITNGIWGAVETKVAHNNMWQVSFPYVGGIADSAGGISVDPMFFDTLSGDFSLSPASLCIDAGMDVGLPYQGSSPDIGAYEYTPAVYSIYYVSTTGNDSNDGLTTSTAWASLDNGDASKTNVLVPGDTVFIMEGTYLFEGTYTLNSNGAAGLPITYTTYLGEKVSLSANGTNNIVLTLEGSNTIIDGFVIRNTTENAVFARADSCIIKNCIVRGMGKIGIRVEGSDCLFYRNIISNAGDEGIKNEGSGDNNLYSHNTIFGSGTNGIELKSNTCRIINNIVVNNTDGIRGSSSEHASFNCVWNNSVSNYTGGVTDSAGGISIDPLFVNDTNIGYDLRWNSPAIDVGLDLGNAFEGSAPDMGAVEYIPHAPRSYYVSTTGDDGNDGLTEGTAWATIDNGELKGLTAPGDTVNIIEGTYPISSKIVLKIPGTASLPILYQAYGSDEVIIDVGTIVDTIIQITGNYNHVNGLTLINSGGDGIALDADYCAIMNCRIFDLTYQGIDITGSDNYIFKNIIHNTTQSGIVLRAGAENNSLFGNTICNTPFSGIWIEGSVGTTSIFNNIIVSANDGIDASAGNSCGYNNIWNSTTNDYVSGVFDGGGGISADPVFADTASYNFKLRYKSPCIDAGTDLGYPFNGLAPDMGAEEYSSHTPRTYYVSTTGNNKYSGLSPDSAWLTIDNGEKNGYIAAGDTVKVLPGEYTISEIILNTSGTAALPITYLGSGMDSTTIIGSSIKYALVILNGNHNKFSNFEVTNGLWDGIWMNGDSSVVSECYVHDIVYDAIDVGGNDYTVHGNQVIKNIVANNGESGIENDFTSWGALIYGNTVYNNTLAAIRISGLVPDARVFNNIVAYNAAAGISGSWTTKCGFNNVYDDWYDGGCYDSAGGISEIPQFVDTANGNFNLNSSSLCIDAGLDLGYPYDGTAPDMGALEYTSQAPNFFVVDSQIVDENQNLNFTVIAGDPDGTVPALTAENLPVNATFIDNGDSSGTFDFTPDFTQAGIYDVSFIAFDGLFADTLIVTITVSNVNQAVTLSAIGPQSVEEGQNLNLLISASDADSTIPTIIVENLPINASFIDNNDGTANFDFTPAYDQEGLDTILVIATDGELSDSELVEITITPAPVSYIEISPSNNIVEALDSFQYVANGYDAGSTFVKLLTDSVAWVTDDPGGTVSLSGLYTAGVTLGNYIIDISYNAMFDTADVEVISNGAVSYVKIEYFDGTPVTDTSISVDNDTTVYYCRAYAVGDVLIGDKAVYWEFVGDNIGNIPVALKEFVKPNMLNPGNARLAVIAPSGEVDTSGVITATAGIPVSLVVSPDTATITADSTLSFSFVGYDADGNPTTLGIVPNWSVSNTVGTIDGVGLFTPDSIGTCNIIMTSGVLIDTTGDITVLSGQLDHIHVEPRTALLNIGDTLQFTALGYDINDVERDNGIISWDVLGSAGEIDTSGLFTATDIGFVRIVATSSIDGITDTSDFVEIQSLVITEHPIGNNDVLPNDAFVPIIAFNLENYYIDDKSIEGIIVNDASLGHGLPIEVASAIDSIVLYCDENDDGYFNDSDVRIAGSGYTNGANLIVFSPYLIPAYTEKTFFLAISTNNYVHDGDSLDVYFDPSVDMFITDGTIVVGDDSVNSLGYGIINGMISDQVVLTPLNDTIIDTFDTIQHIMTIDLPKNGYHNDTLSSFSTVNLGTAGLMDIDSVCLHADNGDNIFEPGVDTLLGRLYFTGDRWGISGLGYELTDNLNRFYITVSINEYPTNDATLLMTIPQNGIEMYSSNDGPYDQMLEPVDTIVIKTNEALTISSLPIAGKEIIPGETTSPLLNIAFHNSYSVDISLDSLRLNFDGTDLSGASQADLDSQIEKVKLYRQMDGDLGDIGIADNYIAEAILSNGIATFDITGINIPGNGGRFTLSVIADIDLQNAKNDNLISFSIADSTEVFTTPAAEMNAVYPLNNNAEFIINSFPAASVTINPVPGKTIFGGQMSELVLDFVLPANGYADDFLSTIQITNIGSQDDADVVSAVKLWKDSDNNGYTVTDELVGTFVRVANSWELVGLNELISGTGKRFFLTIDVIDKNFDGGTIHYIIPQGGCNYSSGMNGPDDFSILNPEAHVVFPSDRITVISISDAEEIIPPGVTKKRMMTFALYNGYSDRNKTLQSITFTNNNNSQSSLAFSDYELGFVSLYHNSTGTPILNDDLATASGRFIDGKMKIAGLNVLLPSEEITYFYILSDLPLDLIDADSLAIAIENTSDFEFSEDVNINGVLPLSRGSYLIVDGSIENQYQQYAVPPVTLSPGDTSVVVFAFAPAHNGDLADYLDSLTIQNSADANDSDIERLQLWIDKNSDNIWQFSDSLLGNLIYTASGWGIGSLDILIDSFPPTFFVTADIAVAATPDRSFNANIPILGVQYQSGNDGPVDQPIMAVNTYSISSSLLRVEHVPMENTYSVGETIEVRFTATNLSASSLTNVSGYIYYISDSSAVTADSAINVPLTLPAGGSTDFVYYYTADSATGVSWQLLAIAEDINDTSAVVSTPTVQIQKSPDNVPVLLINSMPASVTQGQTNVFPLSLKVSHPDSSPNSAPVRLDSLFLTIENSLGQPQLASDIFDRVVFTAGYANLEIIETIPAVTVLPLYFDTPVIIEANEEQNFSLLVDIDSNATAPNFVISLNSATDLPLVDDNNDQAVSVDSLTNFPLKTASCRIDSPSYVMGLNYNPIINPFANYGQNSFEMIELKLNHPGAVSSSQIQLSSVSFQLLDEFDSPIDISSVFEKIQIRKQMLLIAEQSSDLDTSNIIIELNSPVTLNPGDIDSIVVTGDIKPNALVNSFKLLIADSTAFEVRDLSSGSEITVISDIDTLITTSLFPITTDPAYLKNPAESPDFCVDTSVIPSVIAGQDSIHIADMTIVYPYTSQYSSLILHSLDLYMLDSTQIPLDPTQLFDKIGYKINNGVTQYQSFVKLSSGAALFEFGSDGLQLDPGDSLSITLVGDIEADVSYDHYTFRLNNPGNIHFRDLTDTTNAPLLQIMFGCDNSFPIQSSVTSVISPAGRPLLEADINLLKNTYGGQTDVELFTGKIHYDQQTQQGAIAFNSFTGSMSKRTINGFNAVAINTVFENIRFLIDDSPVAVDSLFSFDSLLLIPDSLISLANGSIIDIAILGDIKENASLGNYRFEFSDSSLFDFEDIQLATQLYPLLITGSYPIYSNELAIAATDLENSFVNYPNPFIDETTIMYFIPEDGHIDIELFTITGESVKTLEENVLKVSGVHESKWFGRNGKDLQVMPGTYFCRLTVRYTSGNTETVMRKISIVR